MSKPPTMLHRTPPPSTGHPLESEAKNVRPSRNRHIPVATHRERHRRRFHSNVGGKAPQGLAVTLIHRRESTVRLAVENQPSGRSGHAGPALVGCRPKLPHLPPALARLALQSAQHV